ncbi:hypothetical protein BGZ58_006767 [Dissophora ornata]|nr:hypothetical protein BGZ58_006767 [Dissophora ornata]
MRYPKERNFYKMEEEEDDGGEASIGEKGVDGMLSKSATTAGAKATDIENEKTGDMVVSERHLALPQKSRIESSVPFHLRGIPMPAEGSLSGAYSMSSNRSSYDASSVVRKYWEASMAARPGPYAHGGPSSTRDLEGGGYFDEGSIFDGSRDSESRMADILSLRTTGSGGSVADTTGSSGRYRYRRSTLNSLFGAQRSVTTISTQSSFPDSLMITEEEFLERVRQHELQMQLEQDGQYYDGRQDSYLSGSTISRSSSIPSLTSSNDPFKTFDSNGVLLDTNPFSDNRAASRASSQRSYWFS